MADGIANLLLRVTSETRDAESDLSSLGRRLQQIGQEKAEAEVGVEGTSDANAELIEMGRKLEQLDGKTATVNVKADTDRAERDLSRLGGVISGLLKQATVFTLAGFAAQAAGALAGIGVALVAALAPAAGLLATFPALLSTIAQGGAVAKLAMTGFGDSFKDIGKQFKEATPAANNFAEFIKGFMPDIIHLRNLAQGPILRGLTDGVQSASGNLSRLNPIVRLTANALGQLAREAGALVGGKAFGQDLTTVGTRNAKIVTILGHAALDVVKALKDVVVVAGPLTTWLAKTAAGWAKSASSAAAAGRETGSMAAFFERTRFVMQRLFSIIGSLAGIFRAVGRAGFDFGFDLLKGADTGLEGLNKLANSAKGQTALKKFFDDLRPATHEIGLLIRDVAKAFAELATQPGLATLISTIRTQLLPILVQVTSSTTQAFGPVLVQAAANFARLMQPLLGASGPLTNFVKLMGAIAGVLADIIGSTPGASAAFATLIGGASVFKAALLVGKFTGLTSLVGALNNVRTAQEGTTAAAVRGRAATLASAAADRIRAAATAIASAAQTVYTAAQNGTLVALIRNRAAMIVATATLWLQTAATTVATAATTAFGIALAVVTSPIFLVIAAIAALIAIGYLLITNWDDVKSALDAVWNFLSGLAESAFGLVKSAADVGLLGPVPLIISHWNTVKSILGAIFNFLKDTATSAFNAIRSVATTTTSAASTAIQATWNAFSTAVTTIWNGIKSAATTAWNGIKNAIDAAMDAAASAVKSTATGLASTLSGVWSGIVGRVKEAFGSVRNAITEPISNALGFVRSLADDFYGAGRAIMQSLAHGVAAMAQTVINGVKSVLNAAKSLIPGSEPKDPSSPLRGLKRSGAAIFENLASGFPAGQQKLTQELKARLMAVPSIVNFSPRIIAPTPMASGTSIGQVQRNYYLPNSPGAGGEAYDAARLDSLLRNEGVFR